MANRKKTCRPTRSLVMCSFLQLNSCQLSVFRFPLFAVRCPLSAVRCCPATDILCQLLLSSSELSLHGQLVRLAIVECRVSIIDCQLAFCLLAQLLINLLEIRYIHMLHIYRGYLYIYTTYNSFMIGRIIHEFAHFHLFIPLKVACIFECPFSHVYIYSIYMRYISLIAAREVSLLA